MKIALLGYGKMGMEIEKIALRRHHVITLTIDSPEQWIEKGKFLNQADVAIDFSTPKVVVENIYRCFDAGIPVVVGTTGWYEYLDVIKRDCLSGNKTFFYATNFSIGVNLFFDLNRHLAKLMSKYPEYEISIQETHHIHKQDAPSATAIVLANDIIHNMERKEKWVQDIPVSPGEIEIKSRRTDNVPGTHIIRYECGNDLIEISHTAKNRIGFAEGAIRAAEWIQGQKGYFEMKDLIAETLLPDTE